jgi:DNA polymerase-3 subunit delta'
LLLTGPAGIGKATLANWLAAQLLGMTLEKLTNYPHILRIEPEAGKAIGIDGIRQLEHFIALKTTSADGIARIVMVHDAHLMTDEAQNALLKTLEEPPADTVLILTSSQQQSLLPTIRSRMQVTDITTPPRESLEAALPELAKEQLAKVMALSGGLPGLAFALANDDQDHPLVMAAQTARQLLQMSSFEKVCQVDRLAKDKEATANVLYILMQMAHAALLTGRGTDRWQKVLKAAYGTQQALNSGTQPKLALTSLMLNL